MSDITVAQALTTAFLTGEPDLDQIVERFQSYLETVTPDDFVDPHD